MKISFPKNRISWLKIVIIAVFALYLEGAVPPPAGAGEKFVKRVYNACKIKLKNGQKYRYAGLSAPDDKDKPFYRICKDANKALVYKKYVTLVTAPRDKIDEVPAAYVYAGPVFVNAELIRNGYALPRLLNTKDPNNALFLSCMQEARDNRRGLWACEDKSDEPYYIGSKSKKEFHRPDCFHAQHLDFDDKIIFRTKEEALDLGFAQGWRCSPLFKRECTPE